MINSENILNKKFISYFNALDYKADEKILTCFLNTMSNLSEQIYFSQKDVKGPVTIIKEIEIKFGMKSNWLVLIEQIINSDDIKKLTELELFTTLWWLSCKNVFVFEQSYYYTQAQKGNIGKILTELYGRKSKLKDVFITKIEIKNFRNIKNICVDINKNIVLLQSKESHSTDVYSLGKTNFLNAVLWCFCKKTISFGINENFDALEDFKSKKTNELDMSVIVSFKDKNGENYNIKRIVTLSHKKKKNKSIKMEGGYYSKQELFINEKAYNLGEYLDKTKDFTLPQFIDDFGVYANDKYKEKIKKEIEKSKDNQMFMTSYDNHDSKFAIQNILNELDKEFQIIIVNKENEDLTNHTN